MKFGYGIDVWDVLPLIISKKMFPILFTDISYLYYDVCELVKSHYTSFSLILNKSIIPFTVIHFDVLGPSKVPNLNGLHWFVVFIDNYSRMTWFD